jgi:hypothetical protein
VVSRVQFGESVKTIITFSLPRTQNETTLFMKVYRNFMFYPNAFILGSIYNYLMNLMVLRVVRETVKEDIKLLENLNVDKMNGKYNVKYDLFPNMYRKLYDKTQKIDF